MKNVTAFKMITIMLLIFAFMVISINESFAFEKYLKTEDAKVQEVTGGFTLILYGGRYLDDIETIAILDREGDKYIFEPYAPEYNYKIKKGVPAREALAEAEKFVSWHSSFRRAQLGKIIDDQGDIIGFEMRPLYFPLTFGVSDVRDVDYWLKDSKVIVKIKLIPSVEMMFRDGDKSKDSD
jgi:hypothetical protein